MTQGREWTQDEIDDQFPEDDCAHEDFEVNVEGRATCLICNERWWPTAEELDDYYGAIQTDETL
jgi:hypothetical protein